MTQIMKQCLSWCVCFAVMLAMGGCAGLKKLEPAVENIAPERTKRERELMENFGEQRDEAQYQSAVQSWNGGDPEGCRSTLEALLARNPQHKGGRELLADLHLDEGDPGSAKRVLEDLLAEFPNDPHVHHSLGLLYDAMHDRTRSLRHLARAVELEPENEFYRTCHEATRATSTSLPDEQAPQAADRQTN